MVFSHLFGHKKNTYWEFEGLHKKIAKLNFSWSKVDTIFFVALIHHKDTSGTIIIILIEGIF